MGERWEKWAKVGKSGYKWEKVGKSEEKWGKVGKSGEKWEKVGKSAKTWKKLEKVGKSGTFFFFNFGQNNYRSQFLTFQIDTQLFFLKFLDKMAAGSHFGLDDNVSYRTRPRYLDE